MAIYKTSQNLFTVLPPWRGAYSEHQLIFIVGYVIANCLLCVGCSREKITRGLRAILLPKCKKEPSKIKQEPLKIAIDCNVKACSLLQI